MANPGGIRAGKAFIELGANDSKLVKGLKAAQAKLRAFGASVQRVGLGVMAAGVAIVAPLVKAAFDFSNAGDALDKMAKRTGVSVETLSELSFAADLSGTTIENVETAVRKMQRTITDAATGTQTAVEAFQMLGLSINDLVGLSPEEQFSRIADALDQVRDPTTRAALAMEVFGKSGTQLLPMLEGGAAGIATLRKQARDLGLTVSTETAAKAALLTDTLGMMNRVLKDVVFEIGSAMSDSLISVAKLLSGVAKGVAAFIQRNQKLVTVAAAAGAALAAVGMTLVTIGTAIKIVGIAFGGLASLAGLLASPVVLVMAAVSALVVSFLAFTRIGNEMVQRILSGFQSLIQPIRNVAAAMVSALQAGDIQLASDILWAGLRVTWTKGVESLLGTIERLIFGTAAAIINLGDTLGFLPDRVAALQAALKRVDKFLGLDKVADDSKEASEELEALQAKAAKPPSPDASGRGPWFPGRETERIPRPEMPTFMFGTFNPFAVRGLGQDRDTRQLVLNTGQTVNQLKRIETLIQNNQLVFV